MAVTAVTRLESATSGLRLVGGRGASCLLPPCPLPAAMAAPACAQHASARIGVWAQAQAAGRPPRLGSVAMPSAASCGSWGTAAAESVVAIPAGWEVAFAAGFVPAAVVFAAGLAAATGAGVAGVVTLGAAFASDAAASSAQATAVQMRGVRDRGALVRHRA